MTDSRLGRSSIGVQPHLRGGAITSITDSSGGTASNTIAVIGATYDQAEVRNAVASLAAKQQEILVILREADIVEE